GGGHALLEVRLPRQHLDEPRRVPRRVLADHDEQAGEALEALARDDGSVAVDEMQLALALPQRERLALDEPDVQRVGEEALDRGAPHPGEAFEPRARLDGADRQDGGAALGLDGAEDRFAGRPLASLDPDLAYREAGFGRGGEGALAQRVGLPPDPAHEPACREHGGAAQRDRADPGARKDAAAAGGGLAHGSSAAFSTIQRTSAP